MFLNWRIIFALLVSSNILPKLIQKAAKHAFLVVIFLGTQNIGHFQINIIQGRLDERLSIFSLLMLIKISITTPSHFIKSKLFVLQFFFFQNCKDLLPFFLFTIINLVQLNFIKLFQFFYKIELIDVIFLCLLDDCERINITLFILWNFGVLYFMALYVDWSWRWNMAFFIILVN